jgi:MFS transporter, DHA1 family, multidrug resistance protein
MNQAAERTQRIPAELVLLLGSLTAFGSLCVDLYLPALPAMTDDLRTGASAMQLSLTVCLMGIAVGALILGPISDVHGRRRPLFCGITAFIVASVACAFAPNVAVFIALRFVQGLGGAAGISIGRAIIRDLYSGATAARFFSLLMLVIGVGPILGPTIGAALLHVSSWRLIFVTLAVAGAVLLVFGIVRLPETLPVQYRSPNNVRDTLRTMRRVLQDRNFLVNALAAGLGLGTIFAYIAGSSFVLENIHGLSSQAYGVVFGLNAVGLVGGSLVNSRVVGRFGPRRLLTAALAVLAWTGLALVVVVLAGAGLTATLACLFVVVTANGFVGPNAFALALNDFPDAAGSAVALIGVMQYAVGPAAAPLVGVAGSHNALPMALVIAVSGVTALAVRLVFGRATGVSSVASHATELRQVLDLPPAVP